MSFIVDSVVPALWLAFGRALDSTLLSFSHNWPYLAASVLIAAFLKVFMDSDRVSALMNRSRRVGGLVATGVAVATPLCSCGTTAVILGMMASSMPWAPIVAFMVSSPLSSPEGLVYSAGIFGWPFAIAYFGASILLGLAGGLAAALLERGGWLKGQLRYGPPKESRPSSVADPAAFKAEGSSWAVFCGQFQSAQGCPCSAAPTSQSGCCVVNAQGQDASRGRVPWGHKLRAFGSALLDVSKFVLPMFVGFAFLGYLINGFVPPWVMASLFGSGRAYGVPLAATVGLPLYINSEAAIPLVRAFMDSGMSPGAIMAFLIAGSGTSVGAIGGALTIARWRVVALVVIVLWVGAIGVGYTYNGLLAFGL